MCETHQMGCCLTGVTMSDLNQKIFPCFRTNHLHRQMMKTLLCLSCCYREAIQGAASCTGPLHTCASKS